MTKIGRYAPPKQAVSKFPNPAGNLRPLLPLLPHPETTAPPRPTRPELPPPPKGWTRTFHAAPAAYPKELRDSTGTLGRRSHPYSHIDGIAPANESREQRRDRMMDEYRTLVDKRYGGHLWSSVEEAQAANPRGMWLAAERWRRDEPVGGITLVMAHANGLQKEHWQPMLRNILARDSKQAGSEFGTGNPLEVPTDIQIDDIWMFDDSFEGASVDLNEGIMGPAHGWRDSARDFLNFIQNVLPGVKAGERAGVPWNLTWHERGSQPDVKAIAVGHSFGGCAMVQAAAERPDLVEGIFLVDPMCPPSYVTREQYEQSPIGPWQLAIGALKRRAEWPSRQAAREAMRDTPFFKPWHDEQFALWLSHGLVPVDPAKPDGAVTLTTPPWAEAAVFCEPEGTARGWDMLPTLPMPVGFIMAGDPSTTMGWDASQEMVWRPPLARNEHMKYAGHLIVQEYPDETADAFWRFLTTLQAGSWAIDRWGLKAKL